MSKDAANGFKSIDNPYENYYKKLVRVQVHDDPRPINGEVVSVTDRHIILKHKDGRTTLIRLSAIAVISELSRQVG